MAKQTDTKQSAKPVPAPVQNAPDTKQGTSGRTYKSRRPRLNLDGFLFVGKKEDPLFGSIEGRIMNVVKRDEGSFFVIEVDNVDGALLLANKDETTGEQADPFKPDSWVGLRVGISGYSAFSDVFDSPDALVGKQVLVEYGGMKVAKKSGRSFRDINLYEASDGAPNGAKIPEARA